MYYKGVMIKKKKQNRIYMILTQQTEIEDLSMIHYTPNTRLNIFGFSSMMKYQQYYRKKLHQKLKKHNIPQLKFITHW